MAVRFDADTDRVTCSDAPPDPTTAGVTITAWAYLSVDRNDASTMVRVHGGAVPGTSTALNMATDVDGVTTSLFTPLGSVVGSSAMTQGAWSRVAVTMQGTSGVVYRADEVGSTTSNSGPVGTSTIPTGVTLGGRSAADASEWFNGRLAYVRIWSGVFNQAAIEAEWGSASPVVTSGLWADYPLTAHTDLTDHSGNGHHLVAGATSTSTEGDPPIGVTATLSATLPALTAAMSGQVTVSAAAAATLPTLTANLAGVVTVQGTAAATLPNLTATAAGEVAVTAALAATLPALRASFTEALAAAPWRPTTDAPVVRMLYTADAPIVTHLYSADPATVA